MRHWLPHFAAVLVIAGCLGLMNWQIERAAYKTEWLESWNSAQVSALSAIGDNPSLPQHIKAHGRFDDSRQIMLDNQVRNFQTGVHVFTPFITDHRIVLVNRGWALWPARTEPLPDPKLDQPLTLSADIQGVLNQPPGVGLRLGQLEPLHAERWPNRMTYFDFEPLLAVFGPDLAPFVIQLSPDHPAHLTGDAWTVVTFGPERHTGYAITWAAIALVVFSIWLVLTIRNYRRTEDGKPI